MPLRLPRTGSCTGRRAEVVRVIVVATCAAAVLMGGGAAAAGVALGAAEASGSWVKPVEGAAISQGFGCTPAVFEPVDPSCPGGHRHDGVDLAVAWGAPVRAPLAGVAQVLNSAGGYGLHVVLDHGAGLVTLFGHLSSVGVATGEPVGAGEVIGAVGSTGNSTGPHLHFEVRRDGIPEDPRLDVELP